MGDSSFFDEEFKSAFWNSLVMVLNGIIIGFSVVLASIIIEPVLLTIASLGVEGILSTIITVFIIFVLIVIFALILIPLNKKKTKYKQ
jgi:uncharacterized membrane protein YedE/YeeE